VDGLREQVGQWHNSAASTLTVPAMAKKADKQQASALDEVRRHVRIFVDLGRVASESTDEDGFLDSPCGAPSSAQRLACATVPGSAGLAVCSAATLGAVRSLIGRRSFCTHTRTGGRSHHSIGFEPVVFPGDWLGWLEFP